MEKQKETIKQEEAILGKLRGQGENGLQMNNEQTFTALSECPISKIHFQ